MLDILLAFYPCRYHSIRTTLDNYAYFISTAAEVMRLAQGHTTEKNARNRALQRSTCGYLKLNAIKTDVIKFRGTY